MAYMTKPELEEGNYIAYTDEPDTVVDAGSGGGGGGGTGEPYTMQLGILSNAEIPNFASYPFYEMNGNAITGFALEPAESGYSYVKEVKVNGGELIAPNIPSNYRTISTTGCFVSITYGQEDITDAPALMLVPNSYCAETIKADLQSDMELPFIGTRVSQIAS